MAASLNTFVCTKSKKRWGVVLSMHVPPSPFGEAVRVYWSDGKMTVVSSCALKDYEPPVDDLLRLARRCPASVKALL